MLDFLRSFISKFKENMDEQNEPIHVEPAEEVATSDTVVTPEVTPEGEPAVLRVGG